MKRETKLAAVATAAAILAGCASGGGSTYGNDVIGDNPLELLLCAPLFICGAKKSTASSGTSVGVPPLPATLTNWSSLPTDTDAQSDGPSVSVSYYKAGPEINNVSVDIGKNWYTGYARYKYDANRKLVSFQDISLADTYTDLSRIGQAQIEVRYGGKAETDKRTPFTDGTGNSDAIALVANPYRLGWDYQSFGAWNQQFGKTSGSAAALSFGAATPASAVPLGGSATFTGKLAGFYVSPAGVGSIAAADLTVNANFSTRSLGFASAGTVLARDLATAVGAPNLNLNGSLSYAPDSSRFSGTLANAGGTMTGPSHGQFYGPSAQELGGSFAIRSTTTNETFFGAYGAKR
jgi:C-lobe and N-lobe beta barrels of Tf-binding protein B